jgi:hypothetical protein
MFLPLIRAAAAIVLFAGAPPAAQAADPITGPDLMRHIQVLASDDFQGRYPGTPAEVKTTEYIVEQFRLRDLEPGGENGSWFQPVPLVERTAGTQEALWTAGGRQLSLAADEIILLGRDEAQTIENAPLFFGGHGARLPDHGIDQLAGADLRGGVVMILREGPDIPGFPSLSDRIRAVTEAGAAAVLVVVANEQMWNGALRNHRRPIRELQSALASEPAILGTMPLAAAQSLLSHAGADFASILNSQPGSSARPVPLPLRVTLHATTAMDRYSSNNVIGRLRGTGNSGENVLFLGHWDHEGICRPPGEPDRICNGAVDNASGIASLIEIAGQLATSPRPVRDILFLATTAEEMGMLGAEYFATHPVVRTESIVAAINMDSVAIHRAGLPVAMIGRGISPALDRVVDATVRAAGRQLDTDDEANVMVQRQDGWKLNQVGIPTIMVSGSFSDMTVLDAFLRSTYHQPNDEAVASIELGGAVEDANLTVALARQLADPAVYQRERQ